MQITVPSRISYVQWVPEESILPFSVNPAPKMTITDRDTAAHRF